MRALCTSMERRAASGHGACHRPAYTVHPCPRTLAACSRCSAADASARSASSSAAALPALSAPAASASCFSFCSLQPAQPATGVQCQGNTPHVAQQAGPRCAATRTRLQQEEALHAPAHPSSLRFISAIAFFTRARSAS